MRGFVNADGFFPSPEPAMWVWYEDLVRHCNHTSEKVYNALGLPVTTSERCNEVKVKQGSCNNVLVEELKNDSHLIPMIDPYKVKMELDTPAIYDRFKKETENVTAVILGF